MQLLIILSSAIIIQAGTIREERTEDKSCVVVDNKFYKVEVLNQADLDRPFLLAIDHGHNILFFSYSLNSNDTLFASAYINLNTYEFGDIPVNNGFAQAVDQNTHDVYIGGGDGIYKYDHKRKKVSFVGAKDVNIWSVYFKDIVYYSDYPDQFLYTLIDGQSIREKTLEDSEVEHFMLDNEDIFFFNNFTGLYSKKKGTEDAVFYRKFPDQAISGITMDVNGKVYVCAEDGIYIADKDTVTLKKVMDLDDGFGLVFDSDNNMIISERTKVYRLIPHKEKTCT